MKRIIIGSFLSFSLLGVGTTYAFSESNSVISTWYHNSFLESSFEMDKTTANEWSASLQKIATDIQLAANNAKEQLMDFQGRTTADLEESIKAHKDHYIQQIQASKEDLSQQNKNEMQSYKEQVKEREVTQITKDVEEILSEVVSEQNGLTEPVK
ncbi:hypothetical protein V7182_17690 [Neobacillus drentensis]|uniref:hypothetical protein n=1 Tax=Neobacillus drentensis TaxID=220684 RepID=UPI002FFE083D